MRELTKSVVKKATQIFREDHRVCELLFGLRMYSPTSRKLLKRSYCEALGPRMQTMGSFPLETVKGLLEGRIHADWLLPLIDFIALKMKWDTSAKNAVIKAGKKFFKVGTRARGGQWHSR